MNLAEAQHILGSGFSDFSAQTDSLEAYEALVFEYKQFFLTKVPLEKLFVSRLQKLEKIHEAFLVLGGSLEEKHSEPCRTIVFGSEIETAFHSYQQEKSSLKKDLFQAQSALRVKALASCLLELEKCYAAVWFQDDCLDETVLVSKEKDPMELLSAIKSYATSGGTLFIHLQNQENNPPEILLHEMKRLSLLFKKYAWTKR